MLVLITYDVSTASKGGASRLRRVAKACESHGKRVQNSVFECVLDEAEYKLLRSRLLEVIDGKEDSLRFYNLGNKYDSKIEHFGAKQTYDQEGVLIL